jgi:hypothetical protein
MYQYIAPYVTGWRSKRLGGWLATEVAIGMATGVATKGVTCGRVYSDMTVMAVERGC